jgi:hypothetical protein
MMHHHLIIHHPPKEEAKIGRNLSDNKISFSRSTMLLQVLVLVYCLSLRYDFAVAFVTTKSPSHRTHPSPITDDAKRSSITLFETKSSSKTSEDLVNDFCMGTNEFWKQLVIQPVKDYVQIQPAGTAGRDPLSKLTAAPELPGIPRPVWLTILGSVPTALGWYGYYKFSVEEELFQYELQTEGKVTGCGGYGTLFPFVFGIIIGFPLQLLHVPGGGTIVEGITIIVIESCCDSLIGVN